MASRGRPRGDHSKHREEICEVVWRLIQKHGLSGVSIRSVAQEAKVTRGTIAHYFDSKDSLIDFAASKAFSSLIEKLHAVTPTDSAKDTLSAYIFAVLPLEETSRLEWSVWLASLAAGRSDQNIGARIRERASEVREIVSTEVVRGIEHDEFHSNDTEEILETLLAYSDGLAVHVLFHPAFEKNKLRSMIDRFVGSL